MRNRKRRFGILGAAALAGLAGAPAGAASITGVCPDGSIFIVQRAELIPCREAKQVRPDELPPLKPEMLPRPYGWEVFHRRNDPNNPYNLVDTGRAAHGEAPLANEPPATGSASATSAPDPAVGLQTARATAPLPPVSAAPPAVLDLDLSADDIRDLLLIVEYSQERAPATLVRGDSPGDPDLIVRIADSRAFESRLVEAGRSAGRLIRGPVLLFSAEIRRDTPFHGNLTFVQGHMAFHPDAARDDEFGVIDGELGDLRGGSRVLGYVVLPDWANLGDPIDIYWNDYQVTATLRP